MLVVAAAMFAASGCSDDGQPDAVTGPGDQPILEFSTRDGANAAVDLNYTCYAFQSQNGGSTYQLKQTIANVVDGTKLSWDPSEISGRDFLFLFVAQPAGTPVLRVVGLADAPLQVGSHWSTVNILASQISLPRHCYYGVVTMSGQEILQTRRVASVMQRMVGQMVFDFYKVNAGAQTHPAVSVDNTVADYVIDRVESIEITYKGLSNRLRFDQNNAIEPVAPDGQSVSEITQVLPIALSTDLRAELSSEEGAAVVEYDPAVGGSIRIKGYCMLPSEEGVTVSMLFNYYDTTPMCADPANHTPHDKSCFEQKQLTLELPHSTQNRKLSVKPDFYTLNSAKIRTNRVIDIPVTGGVDLETAWNIQPNQ